MTRRSVPITSAAEVLERNAALDRDLRDLATQIPAEVLTSDPGDGEWTLAQVLAHLGEFPRYFARDLSAWIDAGPGRDALLVGRTHEHPVRLAAVTDPPAEAERLRADMERSLQELAAVLERLGDEHLTAPMNNRKYGVESLTAYLNRYVLGHKADHVEQLRWTLDRVATADPR